MVPSCGYLETVLVNFAKNNAVFLKTVGAHHREGPVLSALPLSCIHASDKFCVIVGMLINAMLTHGHNPSQLLNIVVKSIPKYMKGSLHSSNNYREISLCNALCKLIDLIIIEKCDGYLFSSELQFAYKRDHSTMLCTAVFKVTVSHFLENGSNVYMPSFLMHPVHLTEFIMVSYLLY